MNGQKIYYFLECDGGCERRAENMVCIDEHQSKEEAVKVAKANG